MTEEQKVVGLTRASDEGGIAERPVYADAPPVADTPASSEFDAVLALHERLKERDKKHYGLPAAPPVAEPAPQTFESTLNMLIEMLDRGQAQCDDSSHPCVHVHIDTKALRDRWNAAKASSSAVVGGESEYQRGFNDCRERAMRIVDESEGYLSRIEALEPLIKDVRGKE